MAKGKHSAALFEVIKGNGSGSAGRIAQSLRTPKWWFKSTPSVAADPAPTISLNEPASVAPQSVAPQSVSVAAPRPATRSMSSAPSSSRSSAVHLDFDRNRKEITLRLRYTTALVSAFGVCALIGSAYVVGRHLNRGPQTASAETLPANGTQYARQAPQPGVADVTRQRLQRPLTGDTPPVRRNTESPVPPAPRPASPLSLVPASAETRMPRTIGLNYVIIGTYPNEEKDNAQAACDFLTRNGIPCTLEKTDFARSWTCLVGTAGFSHISSPDYKTYVDNIIKLAKSFPTSHFNQLQPAAYKWKGN
jgi:hypothetical protein